MAIEQGIIMNNKLSYTRRKPLYGGEHDSHFEIDTKERTYQAQYANIYYLRLATLKPLLKRLACEKWTTHATHTERVLDVVQGELTWIIGTIYMDMPLKPQILQDLVSDINLAAAVPAQPWRDPRSDTIQLEDESGRLSIVGHKLLEETLCTGIVVAVLGSETTSGEFDVIDILYPGSVSTSAFSDASSKVEIANRPQGIIDLKLNSSSQENRKAKDDAAQIAIVSGLNLSGQEHSSQSLDLLADYLSGELFSSWTPGKRASICALVVAGNSMDATSAVEDDAMSRRLMKNKKYGYDSASFNARPGQVLDDFLDEICKTIDVILVPGDQDPTNTTLPQQPINKIMLPKSSRYHSKSLQLSTNPAMPIINNRKIFVTAGQTIEDLKHYLNSSFVTESMLSTATTENQDPEALALAVETLKWGHFAPTAPDTLWTYPYADKDPFIIDTYPDVYIVGNQASFADRLVQIDNAQKRSCRVILIPEFSRTGEVVLLNLTTLDCEVISFRQMA